MQQRLEDTQIILKETTMSSEKGKILITGGTGFVGKHLQEELRKRGANFFAFGKRDFNLSEREQAEAVFKKNPDADSILHLACYQAAGEFPAKHTGDQFFINNLIHTHVLEAWRKFIPHAKFIGIGSSCAYPSDAPVLTEDNLFSGPIHGSVYSYAFTKRLLCTGILAYNDQFKLDGTYLIPATMFGEHDDFHVTTAHVPGALMGKFVRAVREGLPTVEVWGDGTQIRDFMDVKEFVRVLLELLPRCHRDVLNVGPGGGRTIKELALTISQAAGFQGQIKFNPTAYVGIKEKFIVTTKLRQNYGLEVNSDLSPGIQRTVKWLAASYDQWKDRRKFP
jgi:GDP-L-fucose synthase